MNIGNTKDKHVFHELHTNISNVITTKVYDNRIILTSITEHIDDLIYDEIESQIVSITYLI